MRKNLHRILTGAPALFIALGGIWATAYPERAQRMFRHASDALDGVGLYIACGVVVVYFGFWWWTSIEPASERRESIKRKVQTLHSELGALRSSMLHAKTDQEFLTIEENLELFYVRASEWFDGGMSVAAQQAFATPSTIAGAYVWTGEHDGTIKEKRNNRLIHSDARLQVLEKFLRDSSFDGAPLTTLQRIKRWRARSKKR